MELLQVEFSENFKKRTQKSFFEKRTQKYQTLKTDFDQKKHPLFATQKVQKVKICDVHTNDVLPILISAWDATAGSDDDD